MFQRPESRATIGQRLSRHNVDYASEFERVGWFRSVDDFERVGWFRSVDDFERVGWLRSVDEFERA
jgi:hypothetical protein